MTKDEWKETKREFSIGENGELTPIKVTHELSPHTKWTTKDIWDIALRFVGALAIAVPLIVFVNQRNAEINKQKGLLTFEIYSSTSLEIHTLLNQSALDVLEEKFRIPQNKLFYELFPKIELIGSKEITQRIGDLKNEFELFELYFNDWKTFNVYDSIFSLYKSHNDFQKHFSIRNDKTLKELKTLNQQIGYNALNLVRSQSILQRLLPADDKFEYWLLRFQAYNDTLRGYSSLFINRANLAGIINLDTKAQFSRDNDDFPFKSFHSRYNSAYFDHWDYYTQKTSILSKQIDSLIKLSNRFLSSD